MTMYLGLFKRVSKTVVDEGGFPFGSWQYNRLNDAYHAGLNTPMDDFLNEGVVNPEEFNNARQFEGNEEKLMELWKEKIRPLMIELGKPEELGDSIAEYDTMIEAIQTARTPEQLMEVFRRNCWDLWSVPMIVEVGFNKDVYQHAAMNSFEKGLELAIVEKLFGKKIFWGQWDT